MTNTPGGHAAFNHHRSVREQKADASLRNWAGHIRLWHVCDNAACAAAHACRGDVPSCWRTNFPRLPERVQLWAFGIMSTKEYGMTPEEMLAALAEASLTHSFVEWLEQTESENPAAAQRM